MNKVFCIIVTYNGSRWIGKTLRLLRESEESVSVVIVDNQSTDNTIDIINREFPEAELILSDRNLGFGGANNIGMQYAFDQGAEFLFLMNQDVYVEPNTLSSLLEASVANPEFWVISPIHRDGTGKRLDYNFAEYVTPPKAPVELISAMIIGENDNKLYPVSFVNAAAWLLPISTFKKVGGFNPLFPHYGEDDNYIQRVEYHKGSVGVLINVFIRHDRGRVGNDVMFNKRVYLRALFLIAADIRKNDFELLIWLLLLPWRMGSNILKTLLRVKIANAGVLFACAIIFYTKIPLVYRTRKRDKKLGEGMD